MSKYKIILDILCKTFDYYKSDFNNKGDSLSFKIQDHLRIIVKVIKLCEFILCLITDTDCNMVDLISDL